MRVLVVGYGSMGRRHAANARALGQTVIVADTDREHLAHAHEAGYVTVDSDPVDAVVIATPASTHARVARDFGTLSAVPLFVEKPLACSVAECDVFTAWPHPTQMVGYNWRFHPDVLAWRPRVVERWDLVCDTRMTGWSGSGYGDPLMECSHEIDLLSAFRGQPLDALTLADWFSGSRGTGVRLRWATGDQVVVRWDVDPRRCFCAQTGKTIECVVPSHQGPSLEQSYRDELAVFLAAARHGLAIEHGATFADGLAVVRIVDEAKQMIGEVVK